MCLIVFQCLIGFLVSIGLNGFPRVRTELEKRVSDLLVSVQTNLDVDPNKTISATNIMEEASSSNNFMQRILNTDAILILASMLAVPLLGGGAKKRKLTKGKRHGIKGKKTRRPSKV